MTALKPYHVAVAAEALVAGMFAPVRLIVSPPHRRPNPDLTGLGV